jgi:hypothetical protein
MWGIMQMQAMMVTAEVVDFAEITVRNKLW